MRLFLSFFLLPFFGFSQSIVENKVDEFTKNKIVRTSWERVLFQRGLTAHARISSIDGHQYLSLKSITMGVRLIRESDELMIKLGNDSVITLRPLKSYMSCVGCGSINIIGSKEHGVEAEYILSEDNASVLEKEKIVKIRFYTSEGYFEGVVKSDKTSVISNSLRIIKNL